MAYTTGTLTYIAGGPIEGAWKLWEYTTTDTLAQVTAAGYITDATFKGMSPGDFVIVVNQTNPQGYILQVQNLTPGAMNVSGTATLAAPAGVGGSQLAFPRNLIDGGDFTTNPWQRGVSFTGIAGAVTYTADRFFAVGGASSSISVSQVTGVTTVSGLTQALQFGRAAANANTAAISLGQVIETLDSIRCQGQTVTLSFWAQAGANWSPANGALNVLLASGTGANQSAASLAAGAWTGYTSLTLTPQQNLSPNSSPNNAGLTHRPADHDELAALRVHGIGAGELHAAWPAVQRHAGRHGRRRRLRADHGRPARDRRAGNSVRASRYRIGVGDRPALFLQHSGAGIRCHRRRRHGGGRRVGNHLHSAAGADARGADRDGIGRLLQVQPRRRRHRGRNLRARRHPHAELHQRDRHRRGHCRPRHAAAGRRRRRIYSGQRGFLKNRGRRTGGRMTEIRPPASAFQLCRLSSAICRLEHP